VEIASSLDFLWKQQAKKELEDMNETRNLYYKTFLGPLFLLWQGPIFWYRSLGAIVIKLFTSVIYKFSYELERLSLASLSSLD
jgi:hypothetical protein